MLVNAVRISIAMWLASHPAARSTFSAADVHRVEGITVCFAGLVLLYEVVQRFDRRLDACLGAEARSASGLMKRAFWMASLTRSAGRPCRCRVLRRHVGAAARERRGPIRGRFLRACSGCARRPPSLIVLTCAVQTIVYAGVRGCRRIGRS